MIEHDKSRPRASLRACVVLAECRCAGRETMHQFSASPNTNHCPCLWTLPCLRECVCAKGTLMAWQTR